MRLYAYRVPPLDNGVYVLADARGDAVVIDASLGEREVLEAVRANGLRVVEVLATHGHADHTFGAGAVKAATGAPLAIHRLDAYRLARNFAAGTGGFLPRPHPSVTAERQFDEGDETLLQDLRITVLHTPGHTEGSSCFHLPDQRVLFSGDTLFNGGLGRVDLPGGDATAMVRSLRRLIALPPDTVVYPGHGAKTTIAAEKAWIDGFSEEAIAPSLE